MPSHSLGGRDPRRTGLLLALAKDLLFVGRNHWEMASFSMTVLTHTNSTDSFPNSVKDSAWTIGLNQLKVVDVKPLVFLVLRFLDASKFTVPMAVLLSSSS